MQFQHVFHNKIHVAIGGGKLKTSPFHIFKYDTPILNYQQRNVPLVLSVLSLFPNFLRLCVDSNFRSPTNLITVESR